MQLQESRKEGPAHIVCLVHVPCRQKLLNRGRMSQADGYVERGPAILFKAGKNNEVNLCKGRMNANQDLNSFLVKCSVVPKQHDPVCVHANHWS